MMMMVKIAKYHVLAKFMANYHCFKNIQQSTTFLVLEFRKLEFLSNMVLELHKVEYLVFLFFPTFCFVQNFFLFHLQLLVIVLSTKLRWGRASHVDNVLKKNYIKFCRHICIQQTIFHVMASNSDEMEGSIHM